MTDKEVHDLVKFTTRELHGPLFIDTILSDTKPDRH